MVSNCRLFGSSKGQINIYIKADVTGSLIES